MLRHPSQLHKKTTMAKNNVFGLYPTGAEEAISCNGTSKDLSLDSYLSVVTTTAAASKAVLPARDAAGQVIAEAGQLKKVIAPTVGTDSDALTLTLGRLDATAASTVVLDANGDNVICLFDGNEWVVIENNIA